jgi:antitoxin component YwqK of YwqJK toxin-antitoxin module
MKRYLLIIFLIAGGAATTFSQNIEKIDGYYYKKGMLYSGAHTEYSSNGRKSMELNILNGLEHGKMELYYENGALKEHREYNEGKKTGIWTTWDEDGTKVAEASYINDVKHGAWYVWSGEGVMLYEMHYTEGAKTGTWKQWNERGELISERTFTK